MSARQAPVPDFDFSIAPVVDDGTGSASMTVKIESNVGGYSNGFILLDEIEDIVLLRDEIESFIETFKISIMNSSRKKRRDNTPAQKPGWCIILEGYLKGYAPAMEPGNGVILRTSSDIVNDLQDMCSFSESEVTFAMAQLGFRPHFVETGAHGWMMRRDPLAVHEITVTSLDDE